jgi:hypothetical protein
MYALVKGERQTGALGPASLRDLACDPRRAEPMSRVINEGDRRLEAYPAPHVFSKIGGGGVEGAD